MLVDLILCIVLLFPRDSLPPGNSPRDYIAIGAIVRFLTFLGTGLSRLLRKVAVLLGKPLYGRLLLLP